MRTCSAKVRIAGTIFGVLLSCPGLTAVRAANLESVRTFNIAPQRLETALIEFSKQADLQVIGATETLADTQTRGVSGKLSSRDALNALLENTSVAFNPIGAHSVQIVPVHGRTISRNRPDDVMIRLAQAETQSDSAQDQNPAKSDNSENQSNNKLEENGQESGESQAEPEVTIVVTGSRLQRAGLVSPVPVSTVSSADIEASGVTTVGDLLSELPSIASTSFNRATSAGLFAPIEAGASLLDLRGLGVNRTLVVVDGRRHIGASATSGFGSTSVDLNTIPVSLINRVEVTTGGGSVAYGADAVSGVVNVILKDDFEGFEIAAQSGVSAESDARSDYASMTMGGNFANERGNAVLNVSYDRNDGVNSALDRDYWRNVQYLAGNPDPLGSPAFILGPATTTPLANLEGVIITGSNGQTPAQFAPDGTIIPFVHGELTGTGGRERGGDGFDLRDTFQIFTPLERRLLEARVTYELTPRMEAFIDGKFVNTEAFTQAQPPADLITFSGTGNLTIIQTDNPFLRTDTALGQALVDAANNDGELLIFSGFYPQMGFNGLDIERNMHQIATGIRGDLPNLQWNYELYYQNGRTQETINTRKARDMVRFQLAFDAVTDTAGVVPGNNPGDPACRSAVAAYTADPSGSTNPDVNACVPVNVFGNANLSQAAMSYFLFDATSRGVVTQELFGGSLAGDLFQVFPAGRLSFAAGFEYRKERSDFQPDAFLQTTRHPAGAIILPTGGEYTVTEGFLEASLPLLANLPFAHSLSIEGGVRFSDYNTIGNTTTWRAGGEWAPVDSLRFRGVYAESVRSPNIPELFSPRQTGFTDIRDPCTFDLVDQGPDPARRLANCTALLAPLGLDPTTFIDPISGAAVSFISGGNPGLQEETSDTFTAGFVATPRFLPGFTVTVDYFEVKIADAVGALDPQTVVNSCVDDFDSIDNQFCQAFARSSAAGTLGRIQDIEASLFNFVSIETNGIDYEFNYRFDVADLAGRSPGNDGALGVLSLTLGGTYLDTLSQTSDPGSSAENFAGSIGQSKHRFNFTTAYELGPFSASWRLRYVGSGELDPNDPTIGTRLEISSADAQTISDVQLRYRLQAHRMEFHGGVNNVFDEEPPTLSLPFTARSAGVSDVSQNRSNLYDLMGRYLYAGVRAKF